MTSPIKEVLQTLSRHAEPVEAALAGVVNKDDLPGTALAALRQASALRPMGEIGYRLHPRLRDYLQDHLQLIPAFQSLAEIGSKIRQVSVLWSEIEAHRWRADPEAVEGLRDSLETTVYDIADSVERNLLILQTLMSTRYGNVRELSTKQLQNRYYQKQTSQLADELIQLARNFETIERDAGERGFVELAQLLRQVILLRIMDWQLGVSEMQTAIRNELYRMRQVARDHKLLARLDMMLQQQPAWRGFNAHLPDELPAFLVPARLPPIRPHAEPLDSDRTVSEELESLAKSLPAIRATPAPQEPPKRYTRIIDPPIVPKPSPASQAVERLHRALDRAGAEGISLAQWRLGDDQAAEIAEDVWLVFALLALRSRQVEVTLVQNLPTPGERFTHTFRDARAVARLPAATAQVARTAGEEGTVA